MLGNAIQHHIHAADVALNLLAYGFELILPCPIHDIGRIGLLPKGQVTTLQEVEPMP